ncbi:uncharacterized protein TNCT_413051 [Trichonephila clavata]|uniref:Uncharacterized protein n=1 Tax=Trichonephila clavata TaxID=2740835 RepID=A0A8X6LVB8_TRICU|nr:uncharacterized protein TNCT_413051 [Trichonephila clavata]
MAIEFNRYIRGKTLDLHELDNVDTTELLDFIKQKMEIKVLNLGRNSINDEYEEKLLERGIVIIEDCNEEELANDLKDDLENDLERCNTSNKSGNVNQVSNSQEKFKSSGKYYICGATVGLVIGLVAAYCLGAAALTSVGVLCAVFIASAVVGALLGAGVGYAVSIYLENTEVKNMQPHKSY